MLLRLLQLLSKNLEVDRFVVVANQKKSKLNSNNLQVESDVEREDRLDAFLSHAWYSK